MRPLLHQQVTAERITREPGHFFYGYYDLQPFSADNRYHLAHKIDFENHLNSPWDTATVGMIRLRDNAFLPLDETLAWNWQQGSMLRWDPAAPNTRVLFNTLRREHYCTKVLDVTTGQYRIIDRPLATVSADGRVGLSINFPRIFGFRPGYGYATLPDAFAGEHIPREDGVFRVDMETGEIRLVLSTYDMVQLARPYFTSAEEENWDYVVNHITLNPSGTRFVALLRGKPARPLAPWRTYTITANSDGTDPYVLLDSVASHYHWKDDSHILFYAKTYGDHVWGMYEFTDRCHAFVRMDPRNTMPGDGHCNYSPDRCWILNDTYPYASGDPEQPAYRDLYLYDPQKDVSVRLLAAASQLLGQELPCDDIRTDLHPRFSPDGSQISFDSVHEGSRHIYRIRMEDLPEDLWTRASAQMPTTDIRMEY